MSTRFFENQDSARRNTSWLIFLFALAVVAMTAMLYALAVVLTATPDPGSVSGAHPPTLEWWQPEILLNVALATLALVAGGSLFKIAQLRGGGSVVAESLGGELVASDTRDHSERVLLNVVEEMSIASGIPTPPVYVMRQETGINAFAAGYSTEDAVVGVTRGCIEQLSREELQGVIAHEFSHIFNGDMRLNIRLMGVLNGILLIGILGYFLLRSSMFASVGRRRDQRDNSGLLMLGAGLGLMVVGFMGTFFGNLIKASVSRQREFLADASAIQYTRDPTGLSNALIKIGGLESGSLIASPNAPESSHLFFGQALRGGMQMLFATHPPLDERIRRLDPSWQGSADLPRRVPGPALSASASAASAGLAALPNAPDGSALDQIGSPTAAHLAYAEQLIAALPSTIHEAAHEPYGARAVVYALVIDRDSDARQLQLEQLARSGEAGMQELTLRLLPTIEALGPEMRIPLVDLCLPALRTLSSAQYQSFTGNLRVLVDADQKIDLFEWTLQRLLITHLAPSFEGTRPSRIRFRSTAKLRLQCEVVLSILAYAGQRSEAGVAHAFELGAAQLSRSASGGALSLLDRSRCGLADLDQALADLNRALPTIKQQVLAACATCIAADHQVTIAEAEIIRAIADGMGCPMPPLLPGQALS